MQQTRGGAARRERIYDLDPGEAGAVRGRKVLHLHCVRRRRKSSRVRDAEALVVSRWEIAREAAIKRRAFFNNAVFDRKDELRFNLRHENYSYTVRRFDTRYILENDTIL